MLIAARLHTKWGHRAPGAAHLGPGRPGSFPMGPRSPSPLNPVRLPLTLFSAMGSLSCSADITDRRAWLAPGPREAGVFDAAAPPPPGPPPGPPGPPPGPWSPPGRARSPGRPGRGPTLKSLGGGRGLGAPSACGGSAGFCRAQGRGLGAAPAPGPEKTRALGRAAQRSARARGRRGLRGHKSPRPAAAAQGTWRGPEASPPCLCSTAQHGAGLRGRGPRARGARTLTRTRTGLQDRGLSGRLRCATGDRVRQALRSPRALQGPVPPALRLPPAPRSWGSALPAALQGPRLVGSAQPVQGARAQCTAPRSPLPAPLQDPQTLLNLSTAPLRPGLLSALQAPGPRAPRPSARPAPASRRKQQLSTSSQPPHESWPHSQISEKLCQRKQYSIGYGDTPLSPCPMARTRVSATPPSLEAL